MSSGFIIEKVRDSASGEIFEIRKEVCGRCKLPVDAQNQHNSCRKLILEENAAERERIRSEQCFAQFHEYLSPHEHQRRLYVHDSVDRGRRLEYRSCDND